MGNTTSLQGNKAQQILQFTKQVSLMLLACIMIQIACAVYFADLGGEAYLPYLATYAALFGSVTVLAVLGRLHSSRILFLVSFISYITLLSVLWEDSLNAQYLMLTGLVIGGYFYQAHEKALRWATDFIFVASFMAIQIYILWPMSKDQQQLFLINSLMLLVVGMIVHSVRKHSEQTMKSLVDSHQQQYDILKGLFPTAPDQSGMLWQTGMIHKIENVSVMFSDLQGYTLLSKYYSDDEVVAILNSLYIEFDRIAAKYGIEKIKTNGDEYMAAKGIPSVSNANIDKSENNALTMCEFALEIQQTFYALCKKLSVPCNIRIGISTGTVTAGIIGTHKPSFDIWGDTVNKASRLEKYGFIDAIHMCNQTTLMIKETFNKSNKYQLKPSVAHQVGSCFKLVNVDLTNGPANKSA